MHFDFVTVWWFPASNCMMVTNFVSQQFVFFDFNIEHIGKLGNHGKFYSVVFPRHRHVFNKRFRSYQQFWCYLEQFSKSSKSCSKIEDLIEVLLNLASKPELDTESSCTHLQSQSRNNVPNWLLFISFLVIVYVSHAYVLL